MAWSSRNCWKQGPSIDNSTRKKIWEENYKTRESLKGVQQSEHFWSFQMTRAGCCCSSPSFLKKKFGSLQTLDKIECSYHCESHCQGSSTLVSNCQIHNSRKGSINRFHRDAATETFYPHADKSVGPEHRYQAVQLSPPDDTPSRQVHKSTSNYCSRYKPPDWERNQSEPSKNRQYRQQNLQKLRKNEEALQQTMQRNKKSHVKIGNWGTEYTRSFKDNPWPKTITPGHRPVYHSRCATPMPRTVPTRETLEANHAVG